MPLPVLRVSDVGTSSVLFQRPQGSEWCLKNRRPREALGSCSFLPLALFTLHTRSPGMCRLLLSHLLWGCWPCWDLVVLCSEG